MFPSVCSLQASIPGVPTRTYCTKKTHRLRELAKLTHVDEQHQPGKQKKAISSSGGGGGGKKKSNKRPTKLQQSEAAAKLGGNQFVRRTVTADAIKDEK